MNENMKEYINNTESDPMDVKDRLKYVNGRIIRLCDYVSSISDNTYDVSNYPPENLTYEIAYLIIGSELENIGIPSTYKVYGVFSQLITLINEIDADTSYDAICKMIASSMSTAYADGKYGWAEVSHASVKLAITKMKQKADFSKAHIFKGLTKASNNYDILKCMYDYFKDYNIHAGDNQADIINNVCNYNRINTLADDTVYFKILEFIDYLMYTTELRKEVESGTVYSKYKPDKTSLMYKIGQILDDNMHDIPTSEHLSYLGMLKVIENFKRLVMCGIIKIIPPDYAVFDRTYATSLAINKLAILLDKYDDKDFLRFNEIKIDAKYPVYPEEFREYIKAMYDYLMYKKNTK